MKLLPSSVEGLRSVPIKDVQPQEHEALRLHRAAANSLSELIAAARLGDDDAAWEARKEILGGPNYKHKTRLVVEHYDYAMTIPLRLGPKGIKMSPAAAMTFAATCTNRRGLSKEQERALVYLEASKFAWTESGYRSHHYPSGTRELVAERPQDVLRIIEVARAHPDITRRAELEALLTGQSISVLVSGEL